MRASSFSSVEQIGQTDVMRERAVVVVVVVAVAVVARFAYLEWQEGVFRAERPAQRAMWRRGRWGRENSSWWVWTKMEIRWSQRSWE